MPVFFLLAFLAICGFVAVLYVGAALLSCWLLQRKTAKNATLHGFIAAVIPFIIIMSIALIVDWPFVDYSETSPNLFFLLATPAVLCLMPSPLICVFFCKKLSKKKLKEEK